MAPRWLLRAGVAFLAGATSFGAVLVTEPWIDYAPLADAHRLPAGAILYGFVALLGVAAMVWRAHPEPIRFVFGAAVSLAGFAVAASIFFALLIAGHGGHGYDAKITTDAGFVGTWNRTAVVPALESYGLDARPETNQTVTAQGMAGDLEVWMRLTNHPEDRSDDPNGTRLSLRASYRATHPVETGDELRAWGQTHEDPVRSDLQALVDHLVATLGWHPDEHLDVDLPQPKDR